MCHCSRPRSFIAYIIKSIYIFFKIEINFSFNFSYILSYIHQISIKLKLKKQNRIEVYGDGKRIINLIEIRYLTRILILFINNNFKGTYNIGDINYGLSGFKAGDQKDLTANIDYTKEFEHIPLDLSSSLTYDVLNQKPSFNVGAQYNFADDGTFRFGGEFDESGQNVGVSLRKKWQQEPKRIFGKAKGGLARILGV